LVPGLDQMAREEIASLRAAPAEAVEPERVAGRVDRLEVTSRADSLDEPLDGRSALLGDTARIPAIEIPRRTPGLLDDLPRVGDVAAWLHICSAIPPCAAKKSRSRS